MSLLVVDASVAAKWFLSPTHEALVEEALDLLRRYSEGGIRFVVPDLFWAEFANVLWKAVRQKRCTQAMATTALADMRDRNFPSVPSWTLLEDAFHIANIFDRSVYDCFYVALAKQAQGQFVTADERLANALAAHLPVKWLGAL